MAAWREHPGEQESPATVLVVDDDSAVQEVVAEALQDEGYRVATAANDAAVPVASREQPDLLLLDFNMPGMDGAAVSRRLRANPATAHIPIVAMTAVSEAAQRRGMLADDWLSKPFDLDELCSVVAAHLPRSR